MPDNRSRATLQAQLSKEDKLDNQIIEYYKQQKRYREWQNSFRKAMELHMSLESGDTTTIKQMYPDLWIMLLKEARQSVQSANVVNRISEVDEMEKGRRDYNKLKASIDKLKD